MEKPNAEFKVGIRRAPGQVIKKVIISEEFLGVNNRHTEKTFDTEESAIKYLKEVNEAMITLIELAFLSDERLQAAWEEYEISKMEWQE